VVTRWACSASTAGDAIKLAVTTAKKSPRDPRAFLCLAKISYWLI
jgi:hypothetical protein